MSSKEEIIHDKINFLLPDIATVRMAIRESMDQYAKQQVIEFQKWTNLNGWFWAPDQWLNYNGDPDPKTTEELYTLYLQQNNNH